MLHSMPGRRPSGAGRNTPSPVSKSTSGRRVQRAVADVGPRVGVGDDGEVHVVDRSCRRGSSMCSCGWRRSARRTRARRPARRARASSGCPRRRCRSTRATIAASKPMPAAKMNQRSSAWPEADRAAAPGCAARRAARRSPRSDRWAARGRGRRRSSTRPGRRRAPGRRSCTPSVSSPLTTSLTVPSPPRATTTSVPSRIARQASAAAWPRLAVCSISQLGRRCPARGPARRARARSSWSRADCTTTDPHRATYAGGRCTASALAGRRRAVDRRRLSIRRASAPAPRRRAGASAVDRPSERLAPASALGRCPASIKTVAGHPHSLGRRAARRRVGAARRPGRWPSCARGAAAPAPAGAHAGRGPRTARAAGGATAWPSRPDLRRLRRRRS